MKKTKAGFTLIELLVVVLIIGILTAIALPQYKLAVAKSRLATMKPILTAIKAAEEAYYLANAEYTEDLNSLDISHSCNQLGNDKSIFTCNKHFVIDVLGSVSTNGAAAYVIHAAYCPDYTNLWSQCLSNRDFSYILYLTHHDKLPNKISCSGLTNLGKAVCKAEGL